MTLGDAAVRATSSAVEHGTRWWSASLVDEGIRDSTTVTTRVIRNLHSPSFRISPESTTSPLQGLIGSVLEES